MVCNVCFQFVAVIAAFLSNVFLVCIIPVFVFVCSCLYFLEGFAAFFVSGLTLQNHCHDIKDPNTCRALKLRLHIEVWNNPENTLSLDSVYIKPF